MWESSPRHNPHGEYDSFTSFDEANETHTYGGIRQLEQTSAVSARTRLQTNPYAQLHYINRELMELGLPAPLLLAEQAELLEDNARVVECLEQLLAQRRRDVAFRETTADELRRALGEEDVLRATISRLERDVDAAERQAALGGVRWQEAERQAAEAEAQRRQAQGELRAAKASGSAQRAQFMHEARKREQETAKLRDRLQRAITDRLRTARVFMEISNPVDRPADSPADRRLLDDLLRRYNDCEVALVARVEGLEDQVRAIEDALAALLSEAGGSVAVGHEADPAARALALVDALRAVVARARAEDPDAGAKAAAAAAADARVAELEAETAALRSEVAQQRAVLAEQREALDAAAAAAAAAQAGGRAFDGDASFGEDVDAEREALRRERSKLEEEIKRFTGAAIELGNERCELKREREEFEARRDAQSTADLITGLPPTPQWMRGMDASQPTPVVLNHFKSMLAATPTQELMASMSLVGAERPRSRGPDAATPLRGPSANAARARQPARTPADVRSARAPRTCTRPGCAAHAPHSHDDAVTPMQLKPPVPRFRAAKEPPAHAASRAASIFK
ncbi:hypothetical protein GGI04_000367 [Coemansia thaxteri]|nr:hypothetical protein GGI04_000367 [Coemansia thaxteri]KAJ2473977.1 hypothetical protein GGI02_000438 [Coemansia sp. RSA 2322]